jgi:hypothetical protein
MEELKETIPLDKGSSSWEDIIKEVDSDGDCQVFNLFIF